MPKKESFNYHKFNEYIIPINFYSENNIKYPFVILSSKMISQYTAFLLIEKDIDLVKNFLNLLRDANTKNLLDLIIRQSLWFSSIITYGKCFSDAEKGRKIKLESKEVLKLSKEEIKQFHDNVIKIRNEYIAHSGNLINERSLLLIDLNPDKQNKKIEKIREFISFIIHYSDVDVEKFLILNNVVKEYVLKKIKELKEILKNEINKISIDELYTNANYSN